MSGPVIDIDDGARGRAPRFRMGCGGLVAALFALVVGARTFAWAILDYQWWRELGQLETWWKQVYVHTAPLFYATLFGFVVLWLLHARALKAAGTGLSHHSWYSRVSSLVILVVAFLLASFQFASWDVARWVGSRGIAASDWRDPVFGRPLEFYFFDLPFYESLSSYLFVLLGLGTLLYWLVSRLWGLREQFGRGTMILQWSDLTTGNLATVRYLAALTLLALAAREWLSRYAALYGDHPFMTGADYIAVNVRIPLTTAWAFALVAAAVMVIIGRTRLALLAIIFLPIRAVVPAIVNSVYVRPNEITMQKPYINFHMKATRDGFGIGSRYREMDWKASATPGKIDVARHQPLLENVRLWDWQAFHDTVSQIQPLRPYTFVDSDVDRYRLGGKLQQVLLSPRELEIQQLGEARNRWPNRHVIYTHGYGVVAADANEITPDGLPRLFIQDAPPKVTAPGLKLTRPEIYFGEVEHEPVFVRTAQPEFNYPSGSDNVHNRYDGAGGIPVGSFGMRVAAAAAFSDWNILLTSYLTGESRMMIRRRVHDRLETLAPFFVWDADPYLVINKEGRLVWLNDGYCVSDRHPYSETVRTEETGRINYARNSVKASVDAYSGETHIYVFDPGDPLVRVYQNLFPALLRNKSEMPADLQEHARYPEWLFRVQAEILLTFHMDDAEAFYNKVDVWDVARRTAGGAERGKQALDPSYMVAVLPEEAGGKGQPEFLLMQPFTPRGKDNLIGFLMARCDGPALGEMVLMELPKEQLFYGPMQIESRINQDQNIAKDLSLWNQQGSQVLRGQMVVLPVDGSFLFVQPIYLQSSQARMPQLKKVAIAYGNELIYTDTYEQAVARLAALDGASQVTQSRHAEDTAEGQTASASAAAPTTASERPQGQAAGEAARRLRTIRDLLDRHRKASAQGQWAEAGKLLEAIEAEIRKPEP